MPVTPAAQSRPGVLDYVAAWEDGYNTSKRYVQATGLPHTLPLTDESFEHVAPRDRHRTRAFREGWNAYVQIGHASV